MLDGMNYVYWKASMRAFIKLMNEKARHPILTGWEPPTTDVDSVKTLKLEVHRQVMKAN